MRTAPHEEFEKGRVRAMRWLWDVIKRAYRRLWFVFHGRGGAIQSSRASTHARYGRAARIGVNTVVDKDVRIGSYSYVNRDSVIEKCDIGAYCSISSGVRINPWVHDIKAPSTSPSLDGSSVDLRKRVFVGDDVLISVNAVILSGVRLEQGCVVAAGAVVTKDVLPYEVVGGVPAKHIGWRFEEFKAALFKRLRWDLCPGEMKEQLVALLSDADGSAGLD